MLKQKTPRRQVVAVCLDLEGGIELARAHGALISRAVRLPVREQIRRVRGLRGAVRRVEQREQRENASQHVVRCETGAGG